MSIVVTASGTSQAAGRARRSVTRKIALWLLATTLLVLVAFAIFFVAAVLYAAAKAAE